MKKLFMLITILLFVGGIIFAQDIEYESITNEEELTTDTTETVETTTTKSDTTIILPDVQIDLDDESETPLRDPGTDLLDDENPLFDDIDIDLINSERTSDRIILELIDDRTNESFSLSTFKLYYGRYENLLIDIKLGKSIQKLNYLITYLRNKRGATGYNTNSYFNTDLNVDDLSLDFIYSANQKIDFNLTAAYYERTMGFYNSPANFSENKLTVPVKFDIVYNIDKTSQFTSRIFYNNLLLKHMLTSGSYQNQFLWDLGAKMEYNQANAKGNNSLKAGGEYVYLSYETNLAHEGYIYFSDKFSIISALALEVGAHLHIYSQKGLYFYPQVFFYIRSGEVFYLKGGIFGKKQSYDIGSIVEDNQITYTGSMPEEAWVYLVETSLALGKKKNIRFGLNAYYNTYASYTSYAFNTALDLYYPITETNINIFEAEATLELKIGDNFNFVSSYKYRLPNKDDLLFFAKNEASIGMNYKHQKIGFEISTRLNYEDIVLIDFGTYLPYILSWNITTSKAITKEVLIELKFNNILNQELFESIRIPTGGFSYYGGIKILL